MLKEKMPKRYEDLSAEGKKDGVSGLTKQLAKRKAKRLVGLSQYHYMSGWSSGNRELKRLYASLNNKK